MATYWENSCSFGLRYVSWYKYLIVSLFVFFSHLGFWSGNLFLIAPFPDLCLLVPFLLVSYTGTCIFRYALARSDCLDLFQNSIHVPITCRMHPTSSHLSRYIKLHPLKS